MADCDRMVRDSAMVTMKSLYANIIALSNGTIAESTRPPFHQNIGLKCTRPDQLRDAYCHLTNMPEDIDKISLSYDILRLEPSDDAFCLINLA